MTRTVLIPAGSSTLTLTAQNLGATPVRVLCTVRSPATPTVIWASVVDGTFTAQGFTVDFSGATPTGAVLDYIPAFS